ncbi:MAG: hypothetical protein JRD04_08260, partial [Deltaproteobacteria bacterium]|nr:hypothetical protein [Deltaproteobacteria bacterium]
LIMPNKRPSNLPARLAELALRNLNGFTVGQKGNGSELEEYELLIAMNLYCRLPFEQCNCRLVVSSFLKKGDIPEFQAVNFAKLEGSTRMLPHRFAPNPHALEEHRNAFVA